MNIRQSFYAVLATMTLFVITAHAEILDRVMAVVNSANTVRIITLSDLQKERQLQKVLGRGFASDQDLLQFLIERYLVEDQMQFSGVEAPDEEVDARLAEIQDFDGVSRNDVGEALKREIRAEKYYESRFGQFIRPTDKELRDYYENHLVPEARAKGVTIPPFEEVMQSPEATPLRARVILEKRQHEIEMWLDSLKRRSEVEVF